MTSKSWWFTLSIAVLAAAPASAVTLVGLSNGNQSPNAPIAGPALARFDSSARSVPRTQTSISGLAVGERLYGIDLRPSDNRIYTVSNANRIYTLDEMTGAATFVATLSTPVPNAGARDFAFDFDPVADAAGRPSLRLLVSGIGRNTINNFIIDATTGAVTAGTDLGRDFGALAYAPAVGGTTTAYYLEFGATAAAPNLWKASSPFETPTLVGSLGVPTPSSGGASGGAFEIGPDGIGYAALGGPFVTLGTGLFSIDLSTGVGTLTGFYSPDRFEYATMSSGLSVSAVPEPGSYALLALGLVMVGGLAGRRHSIH